MRLKHVLNLAPLLFWNPCYCDEMKISVAVHDYAGVPDSVLEEGLRVAAGSLSRAGVTVNWGRCQEASDPGQLLMNILPEAMARRIAGNARQQGHSITAGPGQFGSTGYVFRDRIAKLAEAAGVPEAVLFGHVLAHEIGHLLLGNDSHSPAGLMRAVWGAADFRSMRRDGLVFESGQARQLRGNVEGRTRASGKAAGSCEERDKIDRVRAASAY